MATKNFGSGTDILIPTRGYNMHQIAYHALHDAGLHPRLVLDADEDAKRYKGFDYVQRIKVEKGVAAVRQFCLDTFGKQIQVDDDLRFYRVQKKGKISKATAENLRALFGYLDKMLETYAHGGLHQRFFANIAAKKNYPYVISKSKYRSLLAYNPELFHKPVRFIGETGEDHSVLIQLAQQGLDWFCVTAWCIDEKEFEEERWTDAQKTRDYTKLMKLLVPKRHMRIRKSHSVYDPKKILAEAKGKIK